MSNISLKKKGKMYECTAFFPSGFPKKWKYVTNLESFSLFLSKDHSEWKYFNVYEKGTKQYLKRFYHGNTIPKVLGLVLVLGISLLTQKFTSNKTTYKESVAFLIPMKNTSSETTSNTSINGIYYCATIPKIQGREKVC
jgi:hypothetical protein